MSNATPTPRLIQPQPFATWNPTDGVWETSQLDLFGRSSPYSAIWPTCGTTRNGLAYQQSLPALPTTASASSSSPTSKALFRTPLASDSSRGGETLNQVRARRGTIALSHEIIDYALHGPGGSPGMKNESETLWSLIETIFEPGDDTPTPSLAGNTLLGREAPAPALLTDCTGPRPAPEFVEWLMGLPPSWVTGPKRALTYNQQITALGNGVLSLQALVAIKATQLHPRTC